MLVRLPAYPLQTLITSPFGNLFIASLSLFFFVDSSTSLFEFWYWYHSFGRLCRQHRYQTLQFWASSQIDKVLDNAVSYPFFSTDPFLIWRPLCRSGASSRSASRTGSGTQTPGAGILPPPPRPGVGLPPNVEILATAFRQYSPRRSGKDYYSALRSKFDEFNNNNRYRLSRNRLFVIISEGTTELYKFMDDAVSSRNLYLEFYDAGFNVEAWLEKRAAGEFNNWCYESKLSP